MSIRQVDPNRLGRLGEEYAARHLRRDRMQILARNWRHRLGEVDLIARRGDTVVFCEVKTRRSTRFGAPSEAVDAEKLERLERLARTWLHGNCRRDQPWRIDLIAMTVIDAHRIKLEHVWGKPWDTAAPTPSA